MSIKSIIPILIGVTLLIAGWQHHEKVLYSRLYLHSSRNESQWTGKNGAGQHCMAERVEGDRTGESSVHYRLGSGVCQGYGALFQRHLRRCVQEVPLPNGLCRNNESTDVGQCSAAADNDSQPVRLGGHFYAGAVETR